MTFGNLSLLDILILLGIALVALPFVIAFLITILEWLLYFIGAFTGVIVLTVMYIIKKWRKFK